LYANCPRALFYYIREKKSDGYKAKERPVPAYAIAGLVVHQAIANYIEHWVSGGTLSIRDIERESQNHIERILSTRYHSIIEIINGQELSEKLEESLKSVV
jgi:hypothetical protein